MRNPLKNPLRKLLPPRDKTGRFAPALLALRKLGRGIREWCGDTAYERYLNARTTRESPYAKQTAAEFYLERVNRRFSKPNRCC